ncbi:MAG: hypothetical protein H8E05_01350 [Bacteroidetes bacterium]|nr:hypothetical protein [Bacteroidota bacterium]
MSNKVHQKLINTHILNSCFSKKVYKSKGEALDASKEIAEYRGDNKALTPYQCGFCKKYHLTKLTGKQKEKQKNKKVYVGDFGLRRTGKNYKKNKLDK